MKRALATLIDAKRLVVFVGEGGVGKTSCAAATAIAAARSGRRVAVLTVDPAPRLGDALGLDGIDDEPRTVDLDTDSGSLVAMRLDTKRTFDRVVESLAPGDDIAARILENPIYQTIAGTLGGSDSYMAFQRLYELVETDDYDLVVIDTPPTAHAEDLLAAPARLASLIESGAPAVLADPAIMIARAGSKLARAGLTVVLGVLERVTGSELRTQVAEFIGGFEGVLDGLRVRAAEVDAMLKRDGTSFVQIVRPSADGVTPALGFRRYLIEQGLPLEAVVVNRLTPGVGEERKVPLEERLRDAPPGTLAAVASIERDLDGLRRDEAGAVDDLEAGIAADSPEPACTVVRTRSLEHDVTGVEELLELAELLGLA